jgi:hypothetical protein
LVLIEQVSDTAESGRSPTSWFDRAANAHVLDEASERALENLTLVQSGLIERSVV